MEYKVPKDRILICKIVVFDSYDVKTGMLSMRDLSDDDTYRMVIFMDGDLIDFRTGDVLSHIDHDDDGLIYGEVRANTMYIDEIYSSANVLNDEEYEYAQELYEYYLMRKKLIEEKKIVMFKQKRLY